MFSGEPLRQICLSGPDRLHDRPVLFVGSSSPCHVGKSFLAYTQDILMIINQQVLEHLGMTGTVQNMMELAV